MKRYAIVRVPCGNPDRVAAYLPGNYKVIWSGDYTEGVLTDPVVVIAGTDSLGWSLDKYVIPRLGSGLMRCDEIDLSHPVMKQIEV